MKILELITKRFGECLQTETTIVDHWKTYHLPRGASTTLNLEILTKEFKLYGANPQGDKLIIADGVYVLIQYPDPKDRSANIELHVRQDHLRPVLITDMSEEEDFEQSRVQPKLSYGFIWREQIAMERLYHLLKVLQSTIDSDKIRKYEADDKSWTILESVTLNKQDPVPQIRNTFKDFEGMETELGMHIRLPSGSISCDRYGNLNVIVDINAVTGILELIEAAITTEESSVEAAHELIQRLSAEKEVMEGPFHFFKENNLETALISAIANSI